MRSAYDVRASSSTLAEAGELEEASGMGAT
jgi:hypothetical protein